MAHLRVKKGSRFWFVRYRDLDTGKWREESTHLLREDQQQTRAAQRIAENKSEQESRVGERRSGMFRDWVAEFITAHYRTDSTRRRATYAWDRLREWMGLKGIRHPREIRYEHARDYMDWRKGVSRNTALYELHFLAFLLNEAIRREFAERNVMRRLGIGRTPAKVKPELSDDDITAIRVALAHRAEWMRTVFEIQLFTGCRVSEASMPIADVDFRRNNITLTDAKRADTDPRKRFEVPLEPHLRRVLKAITGDRTAPVLTREMLSRYNEALTGACGTTSHSLRVTFITRCHRGGLSEREAMRLVNHSTRLVHSIYSRLGADDVRAARKRVVFPPPPS